MRKINLRNYVSEMYPFPRWHEKVAGMSEEQVLAIYLRFIRDDQKPKPTTPEELEQEIKEEEAEQDAQLHLF